MSGFSRLVLEAAIKRPFCVRWARAFFSIERHRALLDRSRAILKVLGYRVVTRHGDGTLGWGASAPFDGIIVTAAADGVPDALLEQLRRPGEAMSQAGRPRPGGRLIIPVGGEDGQVMTRVVCTGADTYEVEETHTFRFVPLVSG